MGWVVDEVILSVYSKSDFCPGRAILTTSQLRSSIRNNGLCTSILLLLYYYYTTTSMCHAPYDNTPLKGRHRLLTSRRPMSTAVSGGRMLR